MKKITLSKYYTFLIALFGSLNFGFGQSIFENPITGINPSSFNPYTNGQVIDANISVTGIGYGSGVTA